MTRNVVGNTEDKLTLNILTPFKEEEYVGEAMPTGIIAVGAEEAEKYSAQTNGIPAFATLCAPLPANESERLEALRLYHINDENRGLFNNLVNLAAHTCHAPIAALTFVESEQLTYPS